MTDANIDPFKTNEDQVNPLDYVKTKFSKEDGEINWEGVAKGKLEADQFIETLKRENEELRRKADQGMAMKDLLEAIKSNPPGNPIVEPPHDTPPAINPPNTDDLVKLVKDTLAQTTNEARETQNKATVVQKLNQEWGANVGAELTKKASELGVSVKRLEEIGKESPQALFNMLGIGSPAQVHGTAHVPASRVALPTGGNIGERTKKYYDELYRTNPKLKYDAKITAQEHRDAIRLGERFFDS